jgi:hypothetical protein
LKAVKIKQRPKERMRVLYLRTAEEEGEHRKGDGGAMER